MKRSWFGLCSAIFVIGSELGAVQAQGPSCQLNCTPPVVNPTEQFHVREHTVMVPRVVQQRQRIQVQEMRQQQRDKYVTVYDQVPEVVNVNTQETVMTTQTQMQSQTINGVQAVYKDVTTPVTVAVQTVENRQVARQVMRVVPVNVRVLVTTQQGAYCPVPGQPHLMQWVSQPTSAYVDQVQYRQQLCQEICTVQVPGMSYATQYQTQKVLAYQPVQQTVQVPVTVQVPQVQTKTQQVVQYRAVARQVVEQETVNVPTMVDREIEVPVTQYVPQVVRTVVKTCEVAVDCPTCQPAGNWAIGR